MPRKIVWSYSIVLAIFAAPQCAFAANPPNPVCLNQEEFLEQARQTMSPKAFELVYGGKTRNSFADAFKPLLVLNDAQEAAAKDGDEKARASLAVTWAECRLDGIEYAPEKLERAREYLDGARRAGDRDATRLYAMYEALGWNGRPASLLAAYPLMVESGRLKPPTATTQDSSKSSAVQGVVFLRLLEGRLNYARNLVAASAPGQEPQAIEVLAKYDTCGKTVTLAATPEAVQRQAVLDLLNGVAALVPNDGLDCSRPPVEFPLKFKSGARR